MSQGEMMKAKHQWKVTVYKIKNGNCRGMYDCSIWYDNILIQYCSGTAFEYRDAAREYGKYLIEENRKNLSEGYNVVNN